MECFDDVQSPEKLNALGEGDGLVFRDAYAAPFDLYQCVSGPGEPFRRMPAEAAARVSESVAYLARHTSGIRLRFRTDSARIALKVRISDGVLAMNHMPLTGSCGFDRRKRDGGGADRKDPRGVKNRFSGVDSAGNSRPGVYLTFDRGAGNESSRNERSRPVRSGDRSAEGDRRARHIYL